MGAHFCRTGVGNENLHHGIESRVEIEGQTLRKALHHLAVAFDSLNGRDVLRGVHLNEAYPPQILDQVLTRQGQIRVPVQRLLYWLRLIQIIDRFLHTFLPLVCAQLTTLWVLVHFSCKVRQHLLQVGDGRFRIHPELIDPLEDLSVDLRDTSWYFGHLSVNFI